MGILGSSGVYLESNSIFTNVLTYKLGSIVVCNVSVSDRVCMCESVNACVCACVRVYVHLQFYRILPIYTCCAFEAVVFLST